ncbi:MAG: hypothetical protein AABY42_02160 [Nitrospirota bacterium]
MRLVNLVLLIVIFVSIITPFLPDISYSPDKGMSVIFTLDVCHASSPSLSVNTEMPTIYECPYRHVPLAFMGFYETSNPIFNPFIISYPIEKPPKV